MERLPERHSSLPQSEQSIWEREQVLYAEVLEAEHAAQAIMDEMDEVLNSAHDRVLAEREVLERLAPKYEAANRRFSDAIKKWCEIVADM